MDLSINTASRSPIYQQLVEQIRSAIAKGALAAEAKLPSVRQLSQQLVINPNTVAKAYQELERDGWLVARQGLGLFVAPPKQELTEEARRRRLIELLDQWLVEAVRLGFEASEVLRLTEERTRQFRWRGMVTEANS